MPLFQISVLNKYLAEQDKDLLLAQYNIFKSYFLNPTIQNNIIAQKEEQFQEGFLRELFVKVLGYTINPEPDFNLTTELKNIKDAKKADGAIINKEKVLAVIELKGTDTTNLTKIEQQAFNYKNNQDGCRYVITSNFQKLRFYIDNAIEHLEWDLFKLDIEGFSLLYLCLAKTNIFNDLAANIKTESVTQEDQVTKQLYKEYSQFRKSLFTNIVELNTNYNKLELFKKTQKLLDRFLFLFFAEDRLLVPPNSVRMILEQWTELKEKFDEYQPLYDRFKKYFGYLNTGYVGKQHEIFAYNGGLFAPDDILDSIKIDDATLYNATLGLSNYDYNSEVDVNILGHIFEHSLTEIEELEREITSTDVVDTKTTKRKKDGVFYTPKYITKYIVENTVGTLCKNKKEELKLQEEDYHKLTKKAKKELYDNLMQYREWLLHITIIDPACGSGAFLNQALEFLIVEHRGIAELEANIFNAPMVFDVESSILENNLFGVDINEESVEIAKLSLWLRTARKGRKLNSLNNNIKCGNSLIDDPAVAGDKAFNWQNEFPHIFERGGFDVVIGNPPYVFARENFFQAEKDFYTERYDSAKYQVNLYLLFIEKGVVLLKKNGFISLIIPNSWMMISSGKSIREFLLVNTEINEVVNMTGYSFSNVNVETVIFTATKESNNKKDIIIKQNKGVEFIDFNRITQDKFSENEGLEFKIFSDLESDKLLETLLFNSLKLNDITNVKSGLKAYEAGKGSPKQTKEDVKNRPFDFNYKHDNNTFEYLEGKDVNRYGISWNGQYLQYGNHLAAPRTFDIFNGSKIIIREITGKYPKSFIATYTDDIYLFNMSNIAITSIVDGKFSLKYILAILNSSLMSYYFLKNTPKSVREMFPKIILEDLRKFPIRNVTENEQISFINKVDNMLGKNKELQKANNQFKKLLSSKFEKININTKLEKWYDLSFADFNKELTKQKVKLSLSEQSEWLTFFEEEKQKALAIKNEIDKTDKDIDQMVYQLYGLTDEEIKIVEGK